MRPPSDRGERRLERVGDVYNPPPATPREEMWRAISSELGLVEERVPDLAPGRARRVGRVPRMLPWLAAAAGLVALGVGIGRLTAPLAGPLPTTTAATAAAPRRTGLEQAAREHLERTESLLSMVRADSREGAFDAATWSWARSLLVETRLLMDARDGGDPLLDELLKDLEWVLVQIVGAAEPGTVDQARARLELELAVGSLEASEVLGRIRALAPARLPGA